MRKNNTWKKEFEYDPIFYLRIKKLLSMLNMENINSIMDLGSGSQYAKKAINEIEEKYKNKIEYYPVDYIEHLPTTIVKDFNKKEFLHKKVDLIICSGIIEYIYKSNINIFVKNICKNCEYIIVSYNLKEHYPNRLDIWVNNFDFKSVRNIFLKNGFILLKYEYDEKFGSLFYFKKLN